MAKHPQITEAEWEVMKVLWDHEANPLTSGDVVRELAVATNWAPRTVKTLLARLVKKGAASVKSTDGRHLYQAKVTRDACIRHASRSFLSRVFDGAVAPALVHFIQDANLSPKQIAELKKILDAGGRS